LNNLKLTLLLLSILAIFTAIGAVSAADTNSSSDSGQFNSTISDSNNSDLTITSSAANTNLNSSLISDSTNNLVSDPGNSVNIAIPDPINTRTGFSYTSIQAAVDDSQDGDTIIVYSGTYFEQNIAINKNLIIVGENQTNTIVDAQNQGCIFYIYSGKTVTISQMTLQNGFMVFENGYGGAIINSGSNLTVDACTFNNNSAGHGGGAIVNTDGGNLTVNGCNFNNNTSQYTYYGYGGAIYNWYNGTLTINDSSFINNFAYSEGGAIYNDTNGNLSINNSTFTSNNTNFEGGAIYNCSNLTVTGSTFTDNLASNGGAIYNESDNLTIIGSTFTNNTAYYCGGALNNHGKAVVHFNRFFGNTGPYAGADIFQYYVYGSVNAENNWWGSNSDPSGQVNSNVDVYPYLKLNVNVSPNSINSSGSSTVMADLTLNSNEEDTSSQGHVLNGTYITFNTDLGIINGAITTNGKATATFHANNSTGTANVSATLDNQTAQTTITIINTSTGTGTSVQPVDNNSGTAPVNLTFSNVSQSGNTYLTTSNSGPSTPQGFQMGDPATYYELTTTASYSGSVTLAINYSGTNYQNESNLKLFHFENGVWVDCTTSVDTANNIIYGSVTSLSPFAILEPSNSPPVLNAIGDKSVNEGQTLEFTVSGSDPDGDNLTYTATDLPTGVSFINGLFTWTPTYQQAGTNNITFNVSDGSSTTSETININVNNVNRPPVLDFIGDKTVDEGQTLQFNVNGSDPDEDTLNYSTIELPTGATFNNGIFTWIPNYNQSGQYTITFTASDGKLSDNETITITVQNVNQAPVLDFIGDKTVDEGQTLQFNLNAADPDEDTITYTTTELPQGATLNGNTFTWTPNHNQAGTYTITFTASDGTLTDTKTGEITVNNVMDNSNPVAVLDGPYVAYEGSEITFNGSKSFDPDGDELTYEWDLDGDGIFEASGVEVSKTWNDDYSGIVTLKVTDIYDASSTADSEVTVQNAAPTASIDSSFFVKVPITMRIGGQPGNSVEMQVIQDGQVIASGKIVRTVGSPNEQEITFYANIDLSKPYTGRLIFDSGGNNPGATPVWVIIDGKKTKVATFQTKKNDLSTYKQNQDFPLIGLFSLVGKGITFQAEASDAGTDKITITWTFGDNTSTTTIYTSDGNNTIKDTVTHIYSQTGTYNITLTVKDDNGAEQTYIKTIKIQ
jgi:hypothetical protein